MCTKTEMASVDRLLRCLAMYRLQDTSKISARGLSDVAKSASCDMAHIDSPERYKLARKC